MNEHSDQIGLKEKNTMGFIIFLPMVEGRYVDIGLKKQSWVSNFLIWKSIINMAY